ncbi:AfsR/SARP family transcriptional regulator [Catenulispora rubra]|uniref:AfsR/SARP family transcriptional regulator n=1 Tax=Catenulispora rubra TaxID=280293 RepID=UPI0018921931|nr:tetratricopeptide repeat protein [Catenulispora rubra]
MRLTLLGTVQVWHEERPWPTGSIKEKNLLAILAMDAGNAVSAQSLAERLWDHELPRTARQGLHVYVSRLRRRLREACGDDLIVSTPAGGYLLDLPAEAIDAKHFLKLFHRSSSIRSTDPLLARSLLRRAEELWRGEPLAGIEGQWAEKTRRVLLAHRRNAALTRIELELQADNPSEDLIGELTELTSDAHTDQKAVALLMSALDTAGRTEEALAAFHTTRIQLQKLGIEPRQELRATHQQILRGNPHSKPSGPAGTAWIPNTLDPDPPHLAGRNAELAKLQALISDDLRTRSGPALYALDGMPGIGKTAFAVRAAHMLRSRCPDGFLQINLRTHHPSQPPITARDALVQLLDDIATPSRQMERANSTNALAALWRRRTSDRRLLLLLDDVADSEQIEALLPAAPGSVVLLTSRRRLSGLPGLRQHTLQPLSDDAAGELLSVIVGRDLPDLRENQEQFARRCGGLPLAMAVAAAYLRTRPTWTLADLNDRLIAAHARSASDQINSRIYAAFALSFHALTDHLRTALCLLAAHPGPDTTTNSVAALIDTDPATADSALEALLEQHLIEETGPHRFRMHDLMREYALTELAQRHTPQETESALARMLDFYLTTALLADQAVHPQRRRGTEASAHARAAPTFENPGQARSWLASEWPNLHAINVLAHARGWHARAPLLPLVLAEYLDRRGDSAKAIDVLELAMGARADPTAHPDDATAARLLTDLAAARIRTGELDLALSYARRALDIWIECDDRYGQADAWVQVGRAHWHARQSSKAIPAFEHAAALYDELGEIGRRAVAEDHLSIQMFELGRHDEAFALSQQALDTARQSTDPALQCDILTNLGEMYREAGHINQALDHFRQAKAIVDNLGDPQNVAVLASNIGAVHSERGEHEAAQSSFHTALELFQALGDRRNEIDTLISLADAHTHHGNHHTAFQHLQQASQLAASTHDPLRQARIQLATGHAHRSQQRLTDALDFYHSALDEAGAAKAPLDQAHALRAIADVLRLRKDPEANAFAQRANTIYQHLHHPAAIPDSETAP